MKTLIALALLATPVFAEPNLTGTYHGIIASGGNFDGTSVFNTEANGATTGTYLFGPPDNVEKGKLTDCSLQGRILHCIWNDAYGRGDFIVQFSENLCAFEGSWYTRVLPGAERSLDGGSLWTGERAESDCAGLSS